MITAAEAVASALALAAMAGAQALATDLVERLDGGNPYFLVTVMRAGGAGTLAVVDAVSGEVIGSAKLEQAARHRLPDRAEAIRRAACPDNAMARRVWLPSRATRSPFYPLWELTWGSERVYVDAQGQVWADPGRRRS